MQNNVDFQQYGKINKTLVNNWFLGYPEYTILSQNAIIQNIVQTYAQESVREWIEIKSVSKDTKNKSDKISKLNKAFETFKVKDRIKTAIELTILMGGCKIYPKIRGDDDKTGGDTLSMPFYKSEMKKGDLLYLKVIVIFVFITKTYIVFINTMMKKTCAISNFLLDNI